VCAQPFQGAAPVKVGVWEGIFVPAQSPEFFFKKSLKFGCRMLHSGAV